MSRNIASVSIKFVSLGLLCFFAQTAGAESLFLTQPTIEPNPNPRVPLAALIRFEPSSPLTTRIVIDDGEHTLEVVFGESYNPASGLPILGMKADHNYRFTINVESEAGETEHHPEPLNYRTPPLPPTGRQFPAIKVNHAEPERMEDGITLLSVRRNIPLRNIWQTANQRKFVTGFSLLIGLNTEGQVVWYYESDTRIAGVDRLENGDLIFLMRDNRMVQMDMLGNELRAWYAADRQQGPLEGGIPIKGVKTLHHQPHRMSTGNFLAFAANPRLVENYYTSEFDPNAPRADQMVMGDRVIEFTPQGEVVWSWDSFEHLDPFRIGYGLTDSYWVVRGFPGHLDWTHGNGVGYDEKNDLVVFSLRLQDAIIAAERKTGRIRWILGEHSDWPEELQSRLLQPLGKLRWPFHAHNPRVTEDGNIVVFDNGAFQRRPFHGAPLPSDQTFSRGVEFSVDAEAMTVREVWASDHELNDDSCNSWAMGDAHRLPDTGNHLVIYALCVARVPGLTYDPYDTSRRTVDEIPYGGRVREFAAGSSERIFDVDIKDPDDVLNWEVYGGLRVKSLYPEGTGDTSLD